MSRVGRHAPSDLLRLELSCLGNDSFILGKCSLGQLKLESAWLLQRLPPTAAAPSAINPTLLALHGEQVTVCC